MMTVRRFTAVAFAGALLALTGCRGMESEKPPIHPNLNMDFQEKFDPQEANAFFADGRAMRPPVPGTVARGFLQADTRFYQGRVSDGGPFVEELPVPITQVLLERGQERYNIFCSVCHGKAGYGQGIVMTGGYGYTPAPSYHTERLREGGENGAPGYIYEVITNGVRNMPGYAQQIPVADRWAIVAYVRALQLSQNADEADLPAGMLARLEVGSSANMSAGRQGGTAPATAAEEPLQGTAVDAQEEQPALETDGAVTTDF